VNGRFKYSVRTSQETHYVSATKPNRSMLFRERFAFYCENHTEHTDTFFEREREREVPKSGESDRHLVAGREKEHRL
jgi:hypothetical protein